MFGMNRASISKPDISTSELNVCEARPIILLSCIPVTEFQNAAVFNVNAPPKYVPLVPTSNILWTSGSTKDWFSPGNKFDVGLKPPDFIPLSAFR